VTRNEIVAVIVGCLDEVMHGQLPAVTEDSRLVEDIDMDSLSTLELLMALEERLGVSFDPDTVSTAAYPTVGALADFVGRLPAATV
jgi:acyl carrier protein